MIPPPITKYFNSIINTSTFFTSHSIFFTIMNFKAMMEDGSRKLRAEGRRRGKHKWQGVVSMFLEKVSVQSEYAGDDWELLYWGRIKTILVNTRQMDLHPWEELLFPRGCFENVPTQLKLPETILEPLEGLSESVKAMIGNTVALADMIKIMRRNSVELKESHRSFNLDLAFLEQRAEQLLDEKVRSLTGGL